MTELPIELAHSDVHFALRGSLKVGYQVLVISEGCPLALRNAMPDNSAGRMSGCLRTVWFNRLKPGYHWVYSGVLPDFDQFREQSLTSPEPCQASATASLTGFHLGSRLQFVWRAYGNANLRSRVQRQLDRQAGDLCRAILEGSVNSVADTMAPIILECTGYSIEG